MAQSFAKSQLATTTGVAFCALFTGANLCISNIVIPTVLLSHPKLPTSTAPDASKTTSATASGRPATPSPHLARQWQHIYNIGSQAGPIAAVGGLSSFLYAARALPEGLIRQRQLLYIAAGLCVAIMPFTYIFLKSTNDEIHRRANAASKGEDTKPSTVPGTLASRETDDLLKRWAKLNLARASLHVTAIGCAMVALSL